MFYQLFLLPKVKSIVIIGNKDGIYKLPNDSGIRILGN